MKQQLLEFLKSDKHNYHQRISLFERFGDCESVLCELVNEGLIVERMGVNQRLFKIKWH